MRKCKLLNACSVFDKVDFILPTHTAFLEVSLSKTLYGIRFEQSTNKHGQVHYVGYCRNLRFNVYENSVYISGSLPCYLYNHNANDICYQELCCIVNEICQLLLCSPTELRVCDFEFGFSIPVNIHPTRIIKRILSHWGTEAKKEYRRGKLTSAKIYHDDYSIKIYNKGFVENNVDRKIKMSGDWLRIEMQYKAAYFKGRIKTAYDLTQQNIIDEVFRNFRKSWRLIKKAPFIDSTNLSKEEIYRIYALLNPLYAEDCQDYRSKGAIKKEGYRFNNELIEIGDFTVFQKIETAFTEKFAGLMTNTIVPTFPAILLAGNWGQYGNTNLKQV